jgi:hypothetical protein
MTDLDAPDPYGDLLDATAADMVRAVLVYPNGTHEQTEALRVASTLVTEQYGVPGLRDLAEHLAADLAEAFEILARVEQRPAVELLDEWHHDEPPPRI